MTFFRKAKSTALVLVALAAFTDVASAQRQQPQPQQPVPQQALPPSGGVPQQQQQQQPGAPIDPAQQAAPSQPAPQAAPQRRGTRPAAQAPAQPPPEPGAPGQPVPQADPGAAGQAAAPPARPQRVRNRPDLTCSNWFAACRRRGNPVAQCTTQRDECLQVTGCFTEEARFGGETFCQLQRR